MQNRCYALEFALVFATALFGFVLAQEHQLLPTPHRLWSRQADTSICLNNTGDCAQSNTLGDQCLSIIGLDEASLDSKDTPQNAQQVRDCICNGDYWNRLYSCNSCLVANNLYPTDLNPDATPLPTLSSLYCNPAGGRSAVQTIDGFEDPVTQDVSGYDVSASTTSDSSSISSQQVSGGGAGRLTPSPDATATDPASARVSPFLNHSANATVTETSELGNSATPTSNSSASSASSSGGSVGSSKSSSIPVSSSSTTSSSPASAATGSGFRKAVGIFLQCTALLSGLLIPSFFSL